MGVWGGGGGLGGYCRYENQVNVSKFHFKIKWYYTGLVFLTGNIQETCFFLHRDKTVLEVLLGEKSLKRN